MATQTLMLRVNKVVREAEDINSYELVDPEGKALPPFTAGAHLDVWVPTGVIRQFSLCSDPRDTGRYVVAVQREQRGRGGSISFHDQVHAGDTIKVSVPINNFPIEEEAKKHLLIAGGIGVTPMLAIVRRLHAIGADYKLYYCARTPAKTAFLDEIKAGPFAARTEFVFDNGDPSQGLDLKSLLAKRAEGEHLYCCGPSGLMLAVRDAAKAAFPDDAMHFEWFSTAGLELPKGEGRNKPFKVKIKATGAEYEVPADKSILDVLRDAGFDLDSSCEEGICGTCATAVLEGEIDHRDLFLTEKAKKEGKWMMICISRAKGDTITIDL